MTTPETIREEIREVLGLDIDPDGLGDRLLIRDDEDDIIQSIDFSEEVRELARLIATRDAHHQALRAKELGEILSIVNEDGPRHITREYRDTDAMRDRINKRIRPLLDDLIEKPTI